MRSIWTKYGFLLMSLAALSGGCTRQETSIADVAKPSVIDSSLAEPERFTAPKDALIRPIEGARPSRSGIQTTSNEEREPSVLKRKAPQETNASRAPRPLPARTKNEGDLDAVTAKAQQLIRQAYGLADRGALYSARSDLMTALQGLCEATDTQNGDRRCSTALRAAMTALDEAADFVVNGDLRADLAGTVAGHRTRVLKGVNLDRVTNLLAMKTYYDFAQEKFVEAGNGMPAASEALCGLGKVMRHLPTEDSGAKRNAIVRALVLQQSAIGIWEGNFHAKNEQGVLYSLLKRPDLAKPLLQEVAQVTNWPAAWANLAEVHSQLGESDLAEAATNEAGIAQHSLRQQGHVKRGALEFQWVSPEQFMAATSDPGAAAVAGRQSPTPKR